MSRCFFSLHFPKELILEDFLFPLAFFLWLMSRHFCPGCHVSGGLSQEAFLRGFFPEGFCQ